MSWERYRRRYRLRQVVFADVPRLGPAGAVARSRAAIDAEYGGLTGFLCDVQVHWDRTEQARVEAAIEGGESTELARTRLRAERWPGRQLLDAYPQPSAAAIPARTTAQRSAPRTHRRELDRGRPRLLFRGLFGLS